MWVATNFHWAEATQYPSWEKGTNATKGGPQKTMHVFFRALSKKGGEGFGPFFYQLMDDTEILSLKQILIWYWYWYVYVFCHHYHQNYQRKHALSYEVLRSKCFSAGENGNAVWCFEKCIWKAGATLPAQSQFDWQQQPGKTACCKRDKNSQQQGNRQDCNKILTTL